MCCRYYIDKTEYFHNIYNEAQKSGLAIPIEKPLVTYGEVFPLDTIPVLAASARTHTITAHPMQWGIMGSDKKRPLLNARVETASSKPTFRDLWASHRCIVPCSWYFEWTHPEGEKGIKYVMQPKGEDRTFLCGLYKVTDKRGEVVILTRAASESARQIHDRMPLMVAEKDVEAWVDPTASSKALNDLAKRAITDVVYTKAGPEEDRNKLRTNARGEFIFGWK